MSIITRSRVIEAIINVTDKSKPVIWGLLSLCSCQEQDDEVVAIKDYAVSKANLSNRLQDLFHLGEDTKYYDDDETVYFRLSTDWTEVLKDWVSEPKVNILEAAIFTFKRRNYEISISAELLVDEFKKFVKLSDEALGILFDLQFDNQLLELSDDYPLSDLLNDYKKHRGLEDNEYVSLTCQGNYLVKAEPGELSRAPFTQPLYAGLEIQKLLIYSSVPLDHYYIRSREEETQEEIDELEFIDLDEAWRPDETLPKNRIIYGAPGTGKSYLLKEQAKESNTIRISFSPETTYEQFVGSYRPYSNEVGKILYGFRPGAFIRAIVSALRKPDSSIILIIEEINRANVSAVFGDIFQLLDRQANGSSEYGITFNNEIMRFLHRQGVISSIKDEVRIPPNLNIWSTMNSADQGVMPMDTAFKRRWSFEFLGIDEGEEKVHGHKIQINEQVQLEWNALRKAINQVLGNNGIEEDKRLGPFFFPKTDLADPNSFNGKLLIYLWDDVLRHRNRLSIFFSDSLSEVRQKTAESVSSEEALEVFQAEIVEFYRALRDS